MNKKQSILLQEKLKKYAKFNYNVMLSGKHGVGKTALIKEIFTEVYGELDTDWLYFSASTMDPWIDFIGIPKNYKNSSGQEVFKIIPPEKFAKSNVKAIYFDEFNRSDEKIRNAVMELIQFKSINGRKFENLKCIWGSINPYDEEEAIYQVEEMDPAQLDRFQIQIELAYDVSVHYFTEKYGAIGKAVALWWKKLSDEQKEDVSPRRLESAINVYQDIGDVSDVFPESINSDSFIETIIVVEGRSYLTTLFKENNKILLKKFLTLDKIQTLLPVFDANADLLKFSLPYFPKDFLLSLLDSQYNNIKKHILNSIDPDKVAPFATSSIYLSLNYIKQIQENDVSAHYNYTKESKSFLNQIKKITSVNRDNRHNAMFSEFCDSFTHNQQCSNDFCFNFVYQLHILDKKPLETYSLFFSQLLIQINNNRNGFKLQIKDQKVKLARLFIFILKIAYFTQYLLDKDVFELNMEKIPQAATALFNLDKKSFSSFIQNLKSIHPKLFEVSENSNLNHLPYILKLTISS